MTEVMAIERNLLLLLNGLAVKLPSMCLFIPLDQCYFHLWSEKPIGTGRSSIAEMCNWWNAKTGRRMLSSWVREDCRNWKMNLEEQEDEEQRYKILTSRYATVIIPMNSLQLQLSARPVQDQANKINMHSNMQH